LFTALIAERVHLKLGLLLLPFLTAMGILSVLYWHETVLHGAGDLPTDSKSVSSINHAPSDDRGHRPAFKLSPIERRVPGFAR